MNEVCICSGCPGCRELQRQMKIMDGALDIAADLAVALKPLLPTPSELSESDREKWQRVVDAIFRAAEYADNHDLKQWGGKVSTSN